ncbi:hypothetical protein HK102_009694 [Quaeritorhiza haematococci]|nr:hypothetical protein HK102_009694 [Quaeritorhiza haematococci]
MTLETSDEPLSPTTHLTILEVHVKRTPSPNSHNQPDLTFRQRLSPKVDRRFEEITDTRTDVPEVRGGAGGLVGSESKMDVEEERVEVEVKVEESELGERLDEGLRICVKVEEEESVCKYEEVEEKVDSENWEPHQDALLSGSDNDTLPSTTTSSANSTKASTPSRKDRMDVDLPIDTSIAEGAQSMSPSTPASMLLPTGHGNYTAFSPATAQTAGWSGIQTDNDDEWLYKIHTYTRYEPYYAMVKKIREEMGDPKEAEMKALESAIEGFRKLEQMGYAMDEVSRARIPKDSNFWKDPNGKCLLWPANMWSTKCAPPPLVNAADPYAYRRAYMHDFDIVNADICDTSAELEDIAMPLCTIGRSAESTPHPPTMAYSPGTPPQETEDHQQSIRSDFAPAAPWASPWNQHSGVNPEAPETWNDPRAYERSKAELEAKIAAHQMEQDKERCVEKAEMYSNIKERYALGEDEKLVEEWQVDGFQNELDFVPFYPDHFRGVTIVQLIQGSYFERDDDGHKLRRKEKDYYRIIAYRLQDGDLIIDRRITSKSAVSYCDTREEQVAFKPEKEGRLVVKFSFYGRVPARSFIAKIARIISSKVTTGRMDNLRRAAVAQQRLVL